MVELKAKHGQTKRISRFRKERVIRDNVKTITFLAALLLSMVGSCASPHTDVTTEQARDLINSMSNLTIVDVREPSEYCDARGHIQGALNYPWTSGVLQTRYKELPHARPILVVCRSGRRSDAAANLLDSNGFSAVYNMLGGMRDWKWETVGCKQNVDRNTP